jgi:2-phosphoglycerate kinase
MDTPKRPNLIVVTAPGNELPYSRGLTATSIMGSGLAPDKAYAVAEAVQQKLIGSGITKISADDLENAIAETLEDLAGTHYAENYQRWKSVGRLDKPLVVLIGGATGVGKSTIASLLASRLGITRVIPTDAIREVMRGMLTKELMPTLHTSSFAAESSITQPLPRSADKAIIGFREQVQVVAVGINALIRRAVVEKTDVVIEGAHCCPGFVEMPDFSEAVAVHMVIAIDSERLHRSHFAFRSRESGRRPADHYLKHFSNIRKIQRYIRNLALRSGVGVIESYDVEGTVTACMDLILERVTVAAKSPFGPSDASSSTGLGPQGASSPDKVSSIDENPARSLEGLL